MQTTLLALTVWCQFFHGTACGTQSSIVLSSGTDVPLKLRIRAVAGRRRLWLLTQIIGRGRRYDAESH